MVDVPHFPNYELTREGHVFNKATGRRMTPTMNNTGTVMVGLTRDRRIHKRSLARLVADAFLEPDERPAFDTPINLDGDRFNNHVANLAWRPRWFAWKYNAQFRHEYTFDYRGGVQNLDTGELFATVRMAAQKYGLLEKEIIIGAQNQIAVWPTWHFYRLL